MEFASPQPCQCALSLQGSAPDVCNPLLCTLRVAPRRRAVRVKDLIVHARTGKAKDLEVDKLPFSKQNESSAGASPGTSTGPVAHM